MYSFLSIIRASFRKDFLFQLSYRLSYFTEILFAFLLILFLFFLSQSFSFSEESVYKDYKGEFFLFSITGFTVVNLMGQCYASITNNLREAQSFGFIEELYVSDNKFLTIFLSACAYTFVKSFTRLVIIFLISWYLSNQMLSIENILFLLAICVLSLISFIGIALIGISIILVFKKGDYLSFIFVGGSLILSGAIYPNDVLPEYLILFAEVLPLTHTLEIIRYELVEISSESSSNYSIIKLVALSIFYLLLGYFLSIQSLQYSREKGNLGDY